MINLTLALYLTTTKSPLKSNLIILTQTIILTSIINFIRKTSWISFIIFILYVGGLIIIFLYISRIAFNDLNISKNNFKILIFKFTFILLSLLLIQNLINLENFNYENKLIYEDNYFFLNIFIIPNNFIIYFIIIILFFILILIIWLLKNNKGPIRQKS